MSVKILLNLQRLLPKLLVGAVFLLGGFLILQNLYLNLNHSAQAASSDNVHGWAWSDTIGWLSFNCTEGGPSQSDICSTSNYGVNIASSTGIFSGYAWTDNVGWISFNQADLVGCPSGSCVAQVALSGASVGQVSGWAKALNSTGSDYGWISLRDTVNGYHGVDISTSTGQFDDYAWGGGPSGDAVVGWISFNCSNESECGISNYYVWTDPGLFNNYPYVEDTSTTPPTDEDFCNDSANYFLGWRFRDDDVGAYENTYELEITNTNTSISDTYSPGIYPTSTIVDNDLQSIGLPVMSSEDLSASPPQVTYGQPYIWQVRVQDDGGLWSSWASGPGFTVPDEYPDCSFTFNPALPHVGDEVTFTDTSDPGSYPPITTWLWDFGDGYTANTQNATHTYFEVAPITITLTITDSAPTPRTCTYQRSVNIRPGDPDYDEVIPR